MPEKSLYERLGGVYAIAAVVDAFSDAILKDPIVGRDSPNLRLRDWSRNQTDERLPGLKWMRTLWVCDVSGGPFKFKSTVRDIGRRLVKAHDQLDITSEEFDAVARVLQETLNEFDVPKAEQDQVMAAFAKHKKQVVSDG